MPNDQLCATIDRLHRYQSAHAGEPQIAAVSRALVDDGSAAVLEVSPSGAVLATRSGRTLIDPLGNFSTGASSSRRLNVRDFGATGDGNTDDTAALQATIEALEALGGGIVELPAGIYKNQGIVLGKNNVAATNPFSTISIEGECQVETVLKYVGPANGTALLFNGNKYSCFSNFVLSNAGPRSATQGIQLSGVTFGNSSAGNTFSGVTVAGFHIGCHYSNNNPIGYPGSANCGSEIAWRDSTVEGCDYGFFVDDFNALNLTFENVDTQGCGVAWFSCVPGSINVLSGSGEENTYDFKFSNATNGVSPASIANFRSEGAGIFAFVRTQVFFDNCLVIGLNPALAPPASDLQIDGGTIGTNQTQAAVVLTGLVANNLKASFRACAFAGAVYASAAADVDMTNCFVANTAPLVYRMVPGDSGGRYRVFGCSTIAVNLDAATAAIYPNRQGTFQNPNMVDSFEGYSPDGTHYRFTIANGGTLVGTAA